MTTTACVYVCMYYHLRLWSFSPTGNFFALAPGLIQQVVGTGTGAGAVGSLPDRSRARSAPRGRALGPQRHAHRLYFAGTLKRTSPNQESLHRVTFFVFFCPPPAGYCISDYVHITCIHTRRSAREHNKHTPHVTHTAAAAAHARVRKNTTHTEDTHNKHVRSRRRARKR